MQKHDKENDEILYENVMNRKVEEQVKKEKQFIKKYQILEKILGNKSR